MTAKSIYFAVCFITFAEKVNKTVFVLRVFWQISRDGGQSPISSWGSGIGVGGLGWEKA